MCSTSFSRSFSVSCVALGLRCVLADPLCNTILEAVKIGVSLSNLDRRTLEPKVTPKFSLKIVGI